MIKNYVFFFLNSAISPNRFRPGLPHLITRSLPPSTHLSSCPGSEQYSTTQPARIATGNPGHPVAARCKCPPDPSDAELVTNMPFRSRRNQSWSDWLDTCDRECMELPAVLHFYLTTKTCTFYCTSLYSGHIQTNNSYQKQTVLCGPSAFQVQQASNQSATTPSDRPATQLLAVHASHPLTDHSNIHTA